MSAKIPIPNTEKNRMDPNYRYMRHTLLTKKVGEFYEFTNMQIVAEQIKISQSNIVSYFTKKLKQPVIVDKKSNKVKVKSLALDVEKLLESYIVETIICKKCEFPELNEDKMCKSCGQDNGAKKRNKIKKV